MLRTLVIWIFIVFHGIIGFAQQTDSLMSAFQSTQLNDSLRFDAIQKLTWSVLFSDLEKAKEYADMHIELANEKNNRKQIARAWNNLGIAQAVRGNYEEAESWYQKALEIREELNDQPGVASIYNNLGILYKEQNSLPRAQEFFLKSLRIHEETGDLTSQSSSLNNIGTIFFEQENFEKAQEYFQRSFNISEANNDKGNKANALLNLALIMQKEERYDLALQKFHEVRNLYLSMDELRSVSRTHYNLGMVFIKQHGTKDSLNDALLDSALYHYNQALVYANNINSKYEIANAYIGLGDVLRIKNDYQSALEQYNRASALARELDIPLVEKSALEGIYKCHRKTGRIAQALEAYERFVSLRDSLTSKEEQKKLIQNQLQYEYDKERLAAEKERLAEKKEQEKQRAIDEKEKQQQKLIIYAVSGGLLLIIVFTVFLFSRFRVIKHQKDLIEEQKLEVEHQRDLTNQQKLKLEHINKELTDSINYAQKIQKAILKSADEIESQASEYFNIYKPKDIVSGDFYWGLRKGPFLYVAVVDCTGHGVPGAFMSLLGISFLNEINSDSGALDTHEILEKLRIKIIRELNQTGAEGENRDGMDAAIYRLDYSNPEKITLQFSGANNSLFLVRAGQALEEERQTFSSILELNGHTLCELKGDKQPIGYYYKMQPFTSRSIAVQKGDALYLSSDGYPDQFGGAHNKRFMIKNLKKMLCEIYHKPFAEQKELLTQAFVDHKGDQDQIDDVCVLGIRV